MEFLDQLKKAILSGAEMYGSASQPAPPEVVKGVLGFMPGVGDAISAYDAYDSAKQGNYGEAALNGLGLLPFVPSLGGVIKGGKIADSLNARHLAIDAYLMESPGKVTLSKVVVPKEMRNQGAGTDFMADLALEADKSGSLVTLTPASDFGGNKARLQEFYKRFGFVQNKGRSKDYEISEAMYRLPKDR